MGFALSMRLVDYEHGFRGITPRFYEVIVFHSLCPDVILATVQTPKFFYMPDVPASGFEHLGEEFQITAPRRQRPLRYSRKQYESRISKMKFQAAESAIKLAAENLKRLQSVDADRPT